jgi:hypothetical protein
MSSMCLKADMRYQIRRETHSKDVPRGSNEETNKEVEIPLLPFARHLHSSECSRNLRLTQSQLSAFVSGGEGGIRTHGTRKGSTVFETARFNHSRTSPHTAAYVLKISMHRIHDLAPKHIGKDQRHNNRCV